MILKNKLPDVWRDDWATEPCGAHTVDIAPNSDASIILCNDDGLASWLGLPTMEHNDRELLQLNVGEGARVELCRLQCLNTDKPVFTNTAIMMQRDATVHMNTITLNGIRVRNNVEVRMQGEGADFYAGGLYLIDHEQQCDNYIFVEHAKPHCTSNELYKGIMDDAARARFNGHVLVQDYAVKTEAYQNNKNILLTDKAHVETRPFLEIYNDDVKCSHGSTIGQLDEQAMFYLQTRGISERTAMTMLSYAFCDEVIRGIGIEKLREVVGDMVKKRLHGEDTSCANCAITCSSPCNGPDANFHIDPSKL